MKTNLPIKLKDGTNVKVGLKVYMGHTKQISYSKREVERYPKTYIHRESLDFRTYLIEHEVISVNESINSRSFILRSDKGCESRYTVLNSCLPELMFSSLKKANTWRKSIEMERVKELTKKSKECKKSAESNYKSELKRAESLKNSANALKIKMGEL